MEILFDPHPGSDQKLYAATHLIRIAGPTCVRTRTVKSSTLYHHAGSTQNSMQPPIFFDSRSDMQTNPKGELKHSLSSSGVYQKLDAATHLFNSLSDMDTNPKGEIK